MLLNLKKRSGRYLDTIEVSDDISVDNFKEIFYKKFHYYPERQRWTLENSPNTILSDGLLKDHGVQNNSNLLFKDLGVQISWRLVFVLEYFGPMVIFPLFYYFPGLVYGNLQAGTPPKSLEQKIAFWLAMFHFAKRELETLFVHRFSNATMPVIRVPLNCGHYWALFGISVGYYLFHPNYMPPWGKEHSFIIYTFSGVMILCELLNFKTHLILRGLRPRGTKERGIPHGWGFQFVSCANYLWESMAWISFCLIVHTLTAWLFTLVAFAQMTDWAWKKHRNYKKQFKDYPRCRRSILPFLL